MTDRPKKPRRASQSRARATATPNAASPEDRPLHPSIEARIDRLAYIVDLMQDLRWERGQTARELAAAWGADLSTVERLSSEASSFLRVIAEPEAIKQRVVLRLEGIISESGRDRVPALKLQLEAMGLLKQAQRSEPHPDAMSEEEHEARLVRIFERPDRVTEKAMRRAGWFRVDSSESAGMDGPSPRQGYNS